MIDDRGPEPAEEFRGDAEIAVAIFEGRDRRFEVARIGQAVRTDGSEFWEAEWEPVVLADVATDLLLCENDAELDAARNDTNFPWRYVEDAQFSMKAKGAELRDNQQFAVGRVEETVLHRRICSIKVDRDSLLHRGVAVSSKRNDAVDKVGLFFGNRQRVPAELVGRCGNFEKRSASDELGRNFFVGPVSDGRTNAIGPRAPIGSTRRGEWRSAELLCVKAERMFLWSILPLRQTSFDSRGGELVPKAGLVLKNISHAYHLSQAVLAGSDLGLVHCFINLVKARDGEQQLMQLIHLYRSREHLVQ